MGRIHDLIEQEGRETAKLLYDPSIVDAAISMMTLERERMGVTYSGFALTGLPHSRLPRETDDREASWHKAGHGVKLSIMPGPSTDARGNTVMMGVPFGPIARLILIYLQSEALRTGSREVELGSSMYAWLNKMNISRGGKTYKSVKEQARRIASCHVTFTWYDGQKSVSDKSGFVQRGLLFDEAYDPSQPRLWDDTVVLGELFFDELTRHPVPLSEEALSHLTNKSLAIDAYIWLAYRLHALDKPINVTWKALQMQFGPGYARLQDFRRKFDPAVRMATAVYQDANVELTDSGMRLYPSRPPIAKRQVLVSSRSR